MKPVAALPGQWGADPFDAGPYARIQAALGLVREARPRFARRALLAGLIAWVPLLVLSAVEGHALGDERGSFLRDIATHVRYLIALPLLLLAEAVCLPQLSLIASRFGDTGLIREESRPRYEAVLASTRSLLASHRAELIILLLAYGIALIFSPSSHPKDWSTWIEPMPDGAGRLSLAGWWRALVSQPLYLVVLFGWVWRLLLWARFLRIMSRLDLRLVPSHPDLAGGLAFTALSIRAFLLVAFALSTSVAARVAQEIVLAGRSLEGFKYTIALSVLIQLLLFAGPLLLLAPPLLRARTRGIYLYGALAEAVGHQFEQRWTPALSPVSAEALDANDFSATTDLYSITANVHNMRLVPLRLTQLVPLLIASLLPFVPVVFVAFPVDEVLKRLANFIL